MRERDYPYFLAHEPGVLDGLAEQRSRFSRASARNVLTQAAAMLARPNEPGELFIRQSYAGSADEQQGRLGLTRLLSLLWTGR
jgi:hypothetical protein